MGSHLVNLPSYHDKESNGNAWNRKLKLWFHEGLCGHIRSLKSVVKIRISSKQGGFLVMVPEFKFLYSNSAGIGRGVRVLQEQSSKPPWRTSGPNLGC